MKKLSAALLVLSSLAVAACSGSSSDSSPATVQAASETTAAPETPDSTEAAMGSISGTAYTFNTPDPIAGATVSLVEFPDISAITAADGSYHLDVPAGAIVTPVIEADGHHSVHLQTFTLDPDHEGLTIEGANFQTPSTDIYEALRGLITGFVGKDPFEGNSCVVVTTVSDKKVVGMTFDDFINFHPHGKPGATVAIEPAVSQPIYFNADVLPDLAQTEVSNDGGALWTNVPAGSDTLSAQLVGTGRATAKVTCEAG